MLEQRLENLKKRISRAAALSGRSLEDISIVAVTKYAKFEDVIGAVNIGLLDIGENYFQKAQAKYNKL